MSQSAVTVAVKEAATTVENTVGDLAKKGTLLTLDIQKEFSKAFGVPDTNNVMMVVAMFLVVYAVFVAPVLPQAVLRWSKNWIVQLMLFAGIVYLTSRSAAVGVAATIAVIVTVMLANERSEGFHGDNNCDCPCRVNMHNGSNNGSKYVKSMESSMHGAESRPRELEYTNNMMSRNREESLLSQGKPKMSVQNEPEHPDHQSRDHNKDVLDVETEMEGDGNSVGHVESHVSDNESEGSALDGSGPLGYGNAGAMNVEEENNKTAEEAVRVAVETVTSQVEKETGSEVDDNLRQEVEEETSDAVAKIASRRPVAEYEVVSVCREIYRKKLS